MLCLILISLKLVENVNGLDATSEYKKSLFSLPIIIEKALARRNDIKELANYLSKENLIVITADGISYSLAKEACLKIKETSYKNVSFGGGNVSLIYGGPFPFFDKMGA